MELVWADEGAVIGKRACFSRKTLKFSVPCVKAASPSSTARPHLVWPKPGKTRSAIAFCCRPGQEPDPRVANQAGSLSKRETVNREEVPRIDEECSDWQLADDWAANPGAAILRDGRLPRPLRMRVFTRQAL